MAATSKSAPAPSCHGNEERGSKRGTVRSHGRKITRVASVHRMPAKNQNSANPSPPKTVDCHNADSIVTAFILCFANDSHGLMV